MLVKNPILKGFHPDPCLIYAKGMYYIATSTFEWFPGVRIHASADLKNWELVSCPLNGDTYINLKGNTAGCGVWAPCLSYCGDTFFLVYSNVRSWVHDAFKDLNNYLITSKDLIHWSSPQYLNSSGFDASLFHDDDGRKWLVNVNWDYREKGNARFAGIFLQEYDSAAGRLVGEVYNIFRGTERGLVEGSHIYKIDGWYYLFAAEGGTEYRHAETVARSRSLFGPYELHPKKHLISTYQSECAIQRAGHGSLCFDGKRWFFAYLCGRPLYVDGQKRCVLGRETSMQEIVFSKDGWPYLLNGTMIPDDGFENYLPQKAEEESANIYDYDFTKKNALRDFQTLRIPFDRTIGELDTEKGVVRLYGKESLISCHEQAVLARRQQALCFSAKTLVSFQPEYYQQMAGLLYRYDEENQYYLHIAYDEKAKRSLLRIIRIDDGVTELIDTGVEVKEDVWLGLDVEFERGRFSYSFDGKQFEPLWRDFDTSILSDEYARPQGFTGAFVGMACQDLYGHSKPAEFKRFVYIEK